MQNMQKLNMQNNCLIKPQYLRSLGHKVTPLVNYKSLSLTQRPRDSHYREVCQCHEMWDVMESPKQILSELAWLWHAVHHNADILRRVPKPVYLQGTQGEPKVESQSAKILAYNIGGGCSPLSGDGSSIPSAWHVCSPEFLFSWTRCE